MPVADAGAPTLHLRDTVQVGVLQKTDIILRTLATRPEGMGLSRIAELTGIKKSTCHRLLTALETLGYVQRVESRHEYKLGLRLLELGTKSKAGFELRRLAFPTMNWLAEATEETVFLCIRKGNEALCVERIDGRQVQVMALQVGGTLPLYLGGAPRCLLASLDDEEIDTVLDGELVQYTEHSPKTKAEVFRLVQETREQGFSLSWEDVVIGVCAVAAPIRDAEGVVVGAISVSGIIQRIGAHKDEVIDLVMTAGERISQQLGYRFGHT